MAERAVVLVTGATRGIGRSIALRFAEAGYQTVVTGRDVEKLKETATLIGQTGGREPLVIPADLRDSHHISRLVGSTLERFKKIDVLVNNAGILHLKPFLEITSEELDEMIEVNLKAVFSLTQKVVPDMISRRSGTIVNIASLAGKHGFKTGAGYCATKFALRGLAASLLLELREYDIRVITVFPGSVNTRMMARNPQAPSSESMLRPEDVADAVYAAVSADPRATLSEIDIRPSNPRH